VRRGSQPDLRDLSPSDIGFEDDYVLLVDGGGTAVAILRNERSSGGGLVTERVL
jgi:hypothetical protein